VVREVRVTREVCEMREVRVACEVCEVHEVHVNRRVCVDCERSMPVMAL
jgi:hypothetical protein